MEKEIVKDQKGGVKAMGGTSEEIVTRSKPRAKSNAGLSLHKRTYSHTGYCRRVHQLLARVIPQIHHRELTRRYPLTYKKDSASLEGKRINVAKDVPNYVLDIETEGIKPMIKRCLEMQLLRGKDTLRVEDVQIASPKIVGWNIPNIFYWNDDQRKLGAEWYMEKKLKGEMARINKQQQLDYLRRKHQAQSEKAKNNASTENSVEKKVKSNSKPTTTPANLEKPSKSKDEMTSRDQTDAINGSHKKKKYAAKKQKDKASSKTVSAPKENESTERGSKGRKRAATDAKEPNEKPVSDTSAKKKRTKENVSEKKGDTAAASGKPKSKKKTTK